MKVFIATPYTQFCDDNNLLKKEYLYFFNKLVKELKANKIDYFLALEREAWGKNYLADIESTRVDYDAVVNCDIVCAIPGFPHSGGVHVECGWASANKKKINLFLECNKEYSPMITGLSAISEVKYYYYEDLNDNLIMQIVDCIKKEKEKYDE